MVLGRVERRTLAVVEEAMDGIAGDPGAAFQLARPGWMGPGRSPPRPVSRWPLRDLQERGFARARRPENDREIGAPADGTHGFSLALV